MPLRSPAHADRYARKMDAILRNLNPSQLAALRKTETRALSVMQGPPGSGKTRTSALIMMYLHMKEDGIIVVACPSNEAATVFYDKLVAINQELNVGARIVRMFSERRENMDRDGREDEFNWRRQPNQAYLHRAVRRHPKWRSQPNVNEVLTKQETEGESRLTQEEHLLLFDHKTGIETSTLARVDIVVCTVGCATDHRLSSVKRKLKRQDRCITTLCVDESSLLIVPYMVPVLAINPKRVFLVGDDDQLPPVVTNESAKNACLDVSLMQMLIATPHMREDTFTCLDITYRMAVPIARVVSDLTYYGLLRPDDSCAARDYSSYDRMLVRLPELRDTHMGFYTYGGYHERGAAGSLSMFNPKEVQITRWLVEQILAAGVPQEKIVVIGMYNAQVAQLREDLAGFRGVTVASVDSFQGKEKNIVIVNTVRSNARHKIGFLHEKRRLNVAISRARDYLLVVGDEKTLAGCSIPDIRRFVRLMHEAGVHFLENVV